MQGNAVADERAGARCTMPAVSVEDGHSALHATDFQHFIIWLPAWQSKSPCLLRASAFDSPCTCCRRGGHANDADPFERSKASDLRVAPTAGHPVAAAVFTIFTIFTVYEFSPGEG